MKKIKKYIVICLSAILFILGAASVSATDISSAKSATFTGRGQISVKAETATINFCIETRGCDAVEVKKTNDKTVEKLKKELSKYCIKEESMYSYEDPATCAKSVSRCMSLYTEEIDGISALIQTMLKHGVTSINCVCYGLKDQAAHQNKALQIAIEDAKSKAQALGITLPLKELVEFGSYCYSSGNCDGKDSRMVTVESNVNAVFAQ